MDVRVVQQLRLVNNLRQSQLISPLSLSILTCLLASLPRSTHRLIIRLGLINRVRLIDIRLTYLRQTRQRHALFGAIVFDSVILSYELGSFGVNKADDADFADFLLV